LIWVFWLIYIHPNNLFPGRYIYTPTTEISPFSQGYAVADVLLSGGLNIRGHADAVFQVTVHSYNTGSNVLLKLGICVFS